MKPPKSSSNEPLLHKNAPDRSIQALLAQGLVWRGAPQSTNSSSPWRDFSVAGPIPSNSTAAIPFNAPEIDRALPTGGLQCGAIHEFFYNDPTGISSLPSSLPALFASRSAQSYTSSDTLRSKASQPLDPPFLIVWIGRRSWPTPFSIPDRFLSSCIFVDPPSEKLILWAIETSLRSSAVKLVISECPRISLTTTKRFSNAAQANRTTAILLRYLKDLHTPSSATTRWILSPTPSSLHFPLWTLSLEKIRGAAPTTRSWIIGLENRYEEGEEVSVRVFPRVVDRCHQEGSKPQRFGT